MSDDNAMTDEQLAEIEQTWRAAIPPPPALPWRDLDAACDAVAGQVPEAAREAVRRSHWDVSRLLREVKRLRAAK